MTDSIRETIIATVVDDLDTALSVSVYRSRAAALAASQLPAVIVSPVRDSPGEGTSLCWQQWELDLMIEVVVNTEPADKAADPIIQLIHSTLMAEPRTLGIGAVTDIQPRVAEFMVEHQGQIIPMNRMGYVVRYRTAEADLTVAP